MRSFQEAPRRDRKKFQIWDNKFSFTKSFMQCSLLISPQRIKFQLFRTRWSYKTKALRSSGLTSFVFSPSFGFSLRWLNLNLSTTLINQVNGEVQRFMASRTPCFGECYNMCIALTTCCVDIFFKGFEILCEILEKVVIKILFALIDWPFTRNMGI